MGLCGIGHRVITTQSLFQTANLFPLILLFMSLLIIYLSPEGAASRGLHSLGQIQGRRLTVQDLAIWFDREMERGTGH